MAILELYGKCKELGYCDCRGFFGCNDEEGSRLKPADPSKPHRINADPMASEQLTEKYAAMMTDDGSGSVLIKCEVCDRSHHETHPHIANIDGDVPIDDADAPEVDETVEAPRSLPSRLQDKPDEVSGQSKTAKSRQSTCPASGRIVRSNHRCKATNPTRTHAADPRVASELPLPISVIQVTPQPDAELAALGAILRALEGLHDERGARILTYVLARTGIMIP